MKNPFHELMNPHCPDCVEERAAARICRTCEVLRDEVERLTRANELLLAKVALGKTETTKEVAEPKPDWKPINRGAVPWRIKAQLLEEEDRNKARVLRELKDQAAQKPETITQDDLDKEIKEVEKARNG